MTNNLEQLFIISFLAMIVFLILVISLYLKRVLQEIREIREVIRNTIKSSNSEIIGILLEIVSLFEKMNKEQ